MEINLPTGETPFALDRDEGEAVWFAGTLTIIKATGENTQGSFSMVEQLAPPGFGPPRHVHDEDDEMFYIIEGEAEFESGDLHTQAGPGTTVYLPHGTPHAWRTTEQTRLIQLTFQTGFEQFFIEMGTPAERMELPPEPEEPPDVEAIMNRMSELGEKYGFELLGPPLGTEE
ncbi:cupin domain-containing protein [Halalkalicoccus salilacus]|uniref:cupin domain-containing protein n=1 Tax=Halalkalicoccus salilacus TaxID=3117459 RepID=UPI00300F0C24